MTKSLNFDFSGDYVTAIVANGVYDPDNEAAKTQHSACEVLIVNTDSSANLYIGDRYCYDAGNGIQLVPGAAISLSLGSGDELYGYSNGNINLNVLILNGRGR